MKKVIALICFLSLGILWAQAQKKIYFEADLLEYDEAIMPDVDRYSGNVRFSHGETVGYCDRANHNRATNQLFAFCDNGKLVHIHVNDSVTLYGEYLIYDGNLRTVSIARQVVLKDNSAALYTDSLVYDINGEVGYYLTGGKMVSEDNVLTSIVGNYYTNENMAYLRDSVKLVNDTYTATCQSASYNTQTEIAYFTSRTHLVSDDNEIYTDRGWYNTHENITLLNGNAELFNKERNLSGDSLYYEKDNGYGQAWNNVQMVDSVNHFIVQGNYIEYIDSNYVLVTDSSVLIAIDEGDSLFLHADTLWMMFDTTNNPDDFFAYNHVKFFRNDLQGACDSMTFHVADSVITMFYNPIVWTGENQLTSDTIFFYIIDSSSMDLVLSHSAFIVSSIFQETEFNQMKGSLIKGQIRDKQLLKVDVIGNAESLYYIQEEDSSLIGINSALASEMRIVLEDNEIKTITFYNNTDGKVYPDAELDQKDRLLKNFRWLKTYRPKGKKDIFIMPVERSAKEEKIINDE